MAQSTGALIILALIVIGFFIPKIPIGITAVVGAIAMAVAGIIEFDEALSAFGSDTVMLILGMMVVGGALQETGATRVFGERLIKIEWLTKNERVFLIVLLLCVCIVSAFISNTATVAIFLPIISSVSQGSKGKISKKNTFMATGIMAVIAGNLTLAASTPQLVAQGILSQTEGCTSLGFFDLTKGALPLVLITLLYFSTFGYDLQKKVFSAEKHVSDTKEEEIKAVLKKDKALIVFFIFVGCIIGFTTQLMPFGIIAAIAACVCILTKCITINRAVAMIDWTAILILGGSMGFSKGLDKSGALKMVANKVTALLGENPDVHLVFAAFLILSVIISTFISNTATVALLLPIGITVSMNLESNPTLFAVGIIIGSGLDFITPIGTPPITMTLSGGYAFKDYVKVGGVLNVACVIVAILTLPLLYGI